MIDDVNTMTINQLTQNNIKTTLFPLPPLPEQQRIVEKIEQLMALCDTLDAQRNERDQKRIAVHSSAIDRMLNAPDKSSFHRSWNFITGNFSELYSVPENVAELKKTILQLGVMGKLVPQDPNDQPASELLKEIAAEKKRLADEGKIKKQKELPPIKPEEVPYKLPKDWVWTHLIDVIDVRDGTHDSPKYVMDNNSYPLVTSKDFNNGVIDFSKVKRISAEDHKKIIQRSFVEKNDILFSMIGGNLGNQVMVSTDIEFSIKNVALLKYYSKELTYPFYIKKYTEYLALNLQQKAIGGAQPFVSLGFLRSLLFPLPPLPEQKRIVEKIDHLMALCDSLEEQIAMATNTRTVIFDAVLARVQDGGVYLN